MTCLGSKVAGTLFLGGSVRPKEGFKICFLAISWKRCGNRTLLAVAAMAKGRPSHTTGSIGKANPPQPALDSHSLFCTATAPDFRLGGGVFSLSWVFLVDLLESFVRGEVRGVPLLDPDRGVPFLGEGERPLRSPDETLGNVLDSFLAGFAGAAV